MTDFCTAKEPPLLVDMAQDTTEGLGAPTEGTLALRLGQSSKACSWDLQ